MTNRKLQSEVDRTLKKIQEGLEIFEEISDKAQSATSSNQKEKYETDLKKEIKKLQRLRDQIKTWLASSEIKDKNPLTEARRAIESKMEMFKVFEREAKTKAYSKEGLQQAAKEDPSEVAKRETRNWVSNCLEKLDTQINMMETEMETVQTKKKGKKGSSEDSKFAQLDAKVQRHKSHVRYLEKALRLMENDYISSEQINELRENVEYYTDNNQEPDFVEDEDIYEALGLDGMNEDDLPDKNSDSEVSDLEDDDEDSQPKPEIKKKEPEKVPVKPTPTPPPTTLTPTPTPAATLKTVASSPAAQVASLSTVQSSPVKKTNTVTSASNTPIAKTTSLPAKVEPTPPAVSAPKAAVVAAAQSPATKTPTPLATQTITPTQNQQSAPAKPNPTPTSTPTPTQTPPPNNAAAKPPLPGNAAQPSTQVSVKIKAPEPRKAQSMPTINPTSVTPVTKSPSLSSEQVNTQAAPPQQQAPTFKSPSPILATLPTPTPPQSRGSLEKTPTLTSVAKSSPLTAPDSDVPASWEDDRDAETFGSFDIGEPGSLESLSETTKLFTGLAIEKPFSGEPTKPSAPVEEPSDTLSMLRASMKFIPEGEPENPNQYPTSANPIFDDPTVFQKFDTDTLFFIFYHQQGTYQQYLAAKELKQQSWRFHKKYLTWFQRHDEPKQITDEYEQGTYVYFDYESGWCQRRKTEFTFEYRYLEDDLMP